MDGIARLRHPERLERRVPILCQFAEFAKLHGSTDLKSASTPNHDEYHQNLPNGELTKETEGQFKYDLGNGQWVIPALRRLLGRDSSVQ